MLDEDRALGRRRRRHKMYKASPGIWRGTHLPALITLFHQTSGPILELGSGVYSTGFLHWACHSTKRQLVTYENNPEFFDWVKGCATPFHEIHCIAEDGWDAIDLSGPWSLALVDHAPEPHRREEIKRLRHAEFVVAHDADKQYAHKLQYAEILPLFRSCLHLKDVRPETLILSNLHDVTNLVFH